MPSHTINIDQSSGPATNSNSTVLQPAATVGPEPVLGPGQTLDNNVSPVSPTVNIATWSVMTNFDAGLKSALMSFIDTTKEGVKYPSSQQGRTKTMVFTFFGTTTQSIAPGEIGSFSFLMSYPPGGNSVTDAVTATNLSALNAGAGATAFTGG